MEYTKEEKTLMRAITWIGEDANDGCEEAQEIVKGLKGLFENLNIETIKRELLISYENFKLITPDKFTCSEQAIDKFLEP